MKTIQIPVVWTVYTQVPIEVEDDGKGLEELIEALWDGPLPPGADFLDDSFRIDAQGILEVNDEEPMLAARAISYVQEKGYSG